MVKTKIWLFLEGYLAQPEVGGGDVARRGPFSGRVSLAVDGRVDVHRVDDGRATRRGQTRADRDRVHVAVRVGLNLKSRESEPIYKMVL